MFYIYIYIFLFKETLYETVDRGVFMFFFQVMDGGSSSKKHSRIDGYIVSIANAQLISFLYTDMTHVVKILPHIRQKTILHSQYHVCVCPQQPWYWLCWTGIIRSPHVEGYKLIHIALTRDLGFFTRYRVNTGCWEIERLTNDIH